MKIVKYDDYAAEFKDFIHKHNNDFKVETKGHSGEYYNKTYMFEDGAVWYECARKVFETVEIEVHLCKVNQTIALFEVEFWSSKDSASKFYYEPWVF